MTGEKILIALVTLVVVGTVAPAAALSPGPDAAGPTATTVVTATDASDDGTGEENGDDAGTTVGDGTVSAAAEPGVTFDLFTTRGHGLTGAPSKIAYGQDLRAVVDYSGLGSGTHEIIVYDWDSLSFGGRDVIARTTVSGDSGENLRIDLPYDRMATHIDSATEADNTLEVRVAALRSNGDVFEQSDWVPLGRADTTVYFAGGPVEAVRGEETTVSVYGWSNDDKSRVFVELRESDLGGSNFVTQVETPLSGHTFGADIDFDPADVPEGDDRLELFVRPNPESDGPRSRFWNLDVVDAPNEPPTASFTFEPSSPTAGETVTFDATGSTDDEGIVAYEWTFDDGASASGATATHAFAAGGSYDVTLTVTDGAGATNATTRSVAVAVGPDAIFSDPLRGADGEGPPTDPDGDGTYDDVDGDGDVDFDDAIALAFADTSGLTDAQRAALDMDGDGDVDFDDAIELAFA